MVGVPVDVMAVRSLEKSVLPVNSYSEPDLPFWCEMYLLTGKSHRNGARKAPAAPKDGGRRLGW